MRFIFLFLLLCSALPSTGQSYCLESQLVVNTSFGPVDVYRALRSRGASNAYYYLPRQLYLAHNKQGAPQFSLLLSRDNSEKITGGIMHLLLQWGLVNRQKLELTDSLQQQDSSAVLAGSLWLEAASTALEIGPDDDEIAIILKKTLNSSSNIPVTEGSKMALSFLLDAVSATHLEEVFRQERKTQAYIRLHYYYQLLPCQSQYRSPQRLMLELRSQVDTWPALLK